MGSANAQDPFALYERLGFVIVSGNMSATKTKTGEWKKNFAFPRGWRTKDSTETDGFDKRASGFALVTGLKSGATAIDIDDPETAQNKKLMALMTNCNLVARTKTGFHYLYAYDARVLNAAGNKLGTRNDGGYIFVAPSVARDDKGRTVAEHKWIRVPRDDEGPEALVPVPESVIEFLRSIDRRYVSASSSSAPSAAPSAATTAATTAPARDAGLMAPAMREASSCGKRGQELMMVREAIVACTDPALEANVPKAAESLLVVLEYCDRRDEHGEFQSLGNFADLGLFFYYVWRRVARFGYDKTQGSESHQWPFYLFNGATYERGQWRALKRQAREHLRAVIATIGASSAQLRARTASLEVKCNTSDLVTRAIADAVECMQDGKLLKEGGLICPTEFERELDMGNYIGFTNGVYDILNDRFMPKGAVPFNVLVSMCTNYAYVGPDDPKCFEMRAQIEEFYRTLFAARTSAMWLLVGSLICRETVCKKTYVFFGEGDSGKTTFTRLVQLTLGDYAVGSNDERALVRVCTGDPEAAVYRAPGSGARPLVHARVRPPAERWIWPAEFGSTFVAGLDSPEVARRRYPRKQVCVHEWAPYHFLMMLEAHRAFRAVGYAEPLIPGAPSALHAPAPRQGTVYAFVTPVMPGIVKIGATTRELADRLREANESDTWRPPEPYVVACAARVTDAFAAERSLHTALGARRVNAHREFFRLTVEETRAVFALLLDPWPRLPTS
jgi:hypothetical protein